MKKPKLSNVLSEDLKKQSKGDLKRRIIANSILVLFILGVVVLAKVYIFKGNIKISNEDTKSPNQKIESQPEIKDENKKTTTTTSAQAAAQPAATTTTTQPAYSQGFTTYVIKEGDTLSQIANTNGMTSKQLMDYNGIADPASIKPGDQIKIPK